MSWGFVAVAAATVYAGSQASSSSKSAAGQQAYADALAIDEQRRQFDVTTQEQRQQQNLLLDLTSNQRAIGNQALNALGAGYGYTPAVGYSGAGPTTQELMALYAPSPQDPSVIPDQTVPASSPAYTQPYQGTSGISRSINAVNALGPKSGSIPAPAAQPSQSSGVTQNPNAPPPSSLYMQPGGSVRIGDSAVLTNGPDKRLNPVSTQAPAQAPGGFQTSPDYEFRRGEGMRGIEGTFAARGGAQSGNALRALSEFNSNLAAGEFGNWWNRNAALAGIGQTGISLAGNATTNAANNISNAAMSTGSNVGNALIAGGDARASGIIGSSNAWGNTVQGLAGLYGYYKRPTTQQPQWV